MKWNEAPHDSISSPKKRAVLFFGVAAVFYAIAIWMNDGRAQSRWFFPYAVFFCLLWAFVGYSKTDPFPKTGEPPRSMPGAILLGAFAGALTGITILTLFILGAADATDRWLALFLGVSTGVQYFLGARAKNTTSGIWMLVAPGAGLAVSVLAQLVTRGR